MFLALPGVIRGVLSDGSLMRSLLKLREPGISPASQAARVPQAELRHLHLFMIPSSANFTSWPRTSLSGLPDRLLGFDQQQGVGEK